jgi:hypothetical protein
VKKIPKIRAVNRNTPYDVTGRVRRLVRAIENGNFGEVTDAIMIIRGVKGGVANIQAHYYGVSQTEVLHYMAARAMDECLGRRS